MSSPLTVGRYTLGGRLGGGASSVVYEAFDPDAGTTRALKLLVGAAADPSVRGEFASLSRLEHPSLVRVHDVGRIDGELDVGECLVPSGTPYLVLELVEGEDPVEALARLDPARRAERLRQIADQLADALDHLHRHGIRHHDVKPDNVLIDAAGRAVLIDLGLATGLGVDSTARGTLAYMAPEALGGTGDHRSDLYGLGATLYHLAAGAPPFAGRGPALVRAIIEREPCLDAVDWLDGESAALILRLLRKNPLARPASARLVRAELARLAGDTERVAELLATPTVQPPAFVGRVAELEALGARLAALDASGRAGGPLVALVAGAPGTGKGRLISEALRRHRIRVAAGAAAPVELLRGIPDDWRATAQSSGHELDAAALGILERLEARAKQGTQILWLEDLSRDALAGRVLQVLLRSGDVEGGRARLLVIAEIDEGEHASAADRALRIELAPLSVSEVTSLVASMTGVSPAHEIAERMQRLAGGIALLVVELAGQWACAGAAAGFEPTLDLRGVAGLATLLRSRRRSLTGAAREMLDALAVWGAPASGETLAELLARGHAAIWETLRSLAATGAVELAGDGARLPSEAHAEAWKRTIPGARRRRLHQRAAGLLEQRGAPADRRAEHLLALDDPRAAQVVLEGARLLARDQQPRRAIALLQSLAQRSAGKQGSGAASGSNALAGDAARLLGELYLQTGQYDAALAGLPQGALDAELTLLRVRVLRRRGDYDRAEAELEALIPGLARGPQWQRAVATLGQLMTRRGQPARALEVTREAVVALGARGGPLQADDAALIEVASLARLALGELDEAERLLTLGERALAGLGDAALLARFHNMLGMVALTRGQLERAAACYRRALDGARRAGDVHGVATYLGGLGSTLVNLGRYGEALTYLSQTVRDLGRLGRTAELAAATHNLASLALLLGDLEQATALGRRAATLGEALDSRHTQGYLVMLEGDVARWAGDHERALERYRAATAALGAIGARRDQNLTRVFEAESLVALGRLEQAQTLLAELDELDGDGEHEGAVAVARGRLQIAGGLASDPEQRRAAAEALASHCARLEARGARGDLWRAAAVLGCLLARQGRERAARDALARARTTWEAMMSEAPELYRERMQQDPDARSLSEAWTSIVGDDEGDDRPGEQPRAGRETPPLRSERGRTSIAYDPYRAKRLLSINKRLNSELRLPRLLELIVDTVIELTDAERGFLILVEDGGELAVKVARNIDQRSLEGEELALSRSIAEQAARTGEPVVTIDAADDGRFSSALSVSDLRLRSVLAVPLTVKGRTVGTIYVDHRLRRGVFGETETALVQDVAEQAAIAIDNARLLAENERRRREIEALASRLESTVESQAAELLEVHEELRSSKQALQTRYDYANIIGRTPKMSELFSLVDRVTDTELPVVVEGASGTGKELVARAIHFNGARAAKPFVSENCGAIPETLLESILFGYERGAFTGADRARKGLFEVADGGTLFLDEVGEMSPAMQTKLLRVLQNGELRRVGGERAAKVDVRLIAASNRDLGQMVAEGAFREDLYYRLNVIRVRMPTLRERREDIPLLVDHFLNKHSGDRPRRVASKTMALLMGYPWPGNVRELENEIMRVAALAGDVVQPEDLSPQIGGAAPLSLSDPDDLALRPRVEHLERELIKRALSRSGGNQSEASRLLGLSRYGLLKKIKRYFGEPQAAR